MKNVLLLLCTTLVSTSVFAATINGDLSSQNPELTRTAASDNPTAPSSAACNCTADRETTTVADNATPLIRPTGSAASQTAKPANGTGNAEKHGL